MRRKRVLGIFVTLLIIVGAVIPIFTKVMAPPPVQKTVEGVVNANITGVRAYDPVMNGIVATYIQNRTNEGTAYDMMRYADPPFDADYYSSAIEDTIAWQEGDPAVVVVSVENGTTVTGDRAGYVAYVNETLDFVSQPQQFDDTELRKIPVPQFDINGTNFIQFTWTPLPDPWGLIMGYTIYRSTDNETWNLHQDVSVDNPVTGSMFNDTKLSPRTTYYYALKVVFVGYEFDNPTNVDNYECVYPGEGSSMMNSTIVDQVYENYTILKHGWNLISIPLIQEEQNLTRVLSSIDGLYNAVQWYDLKDLSKPWKHYKVGKPLGTDLVELNETMGFWIHITNPGETIFLYNGTQPTSNRTIRLYQGWNMVGYPSLTSYNRTEGLNNLTFDDQVDVIWSYNASNQMWEEMGESDSFILGRGYYIHAKSQCEWEVPL